MGNWYLPHQWLEVTFAVLFICLLAWLFSRLAIFLLRVLGRLAWVIGLPPLPMARGLRVRFNLPACLSASVPLPVSIYLSTCLSVFLLACLSVSCLPVYLLAYCLACLPLPFLLTCLSACFLASLLDVMPIFTFLVCWVACLPVSVSLLYSVCPSACLCDFQLNHGKLLVITY